MRIDYFIYYRINAGQTEEFTASLVTLQAAVQAATGVAGHFRRRLDDPLTWMEVYEGVSDPRRFEVELGALVMRHGLHAFLAPGSVRHLERFRCLD